MFKIRQSGSWVEIHDATKQDKLPTIVNDRYLHTNSSTGALEWSEVGGGGGGASIIEKTYAELKAMKDGSTLTPGQWYRITDYVATATQTKTQATTNQYDIIVLAIANNKLSEEARAIQHAGDTYFANSNLAAWKVWYSLDNDENRFTWADITNGKGVVYHLIDEFDNDVWYDFKLIQVMNTNKYDRFYYLFDNNGVDASLNTTSTITCYSNHFGHYIWSDKYSIGRNICYGGNSFYSNTIGNNSINNTIGNKFYSNTIGNNFGSNTIGNYFFSNTIGNYFNGNTIGNDFFSNTIGNNFSYNTIGTQTTDVYWQYSSFGDGIQYVNITAYGTSSSYKSGIHIPNGYAGTSSSKKTLSSVTNNTTYYLKNTELS